MKNPSLIIRSRAISGEALSEILSEFAARYNRLNFQAWKDTSGGGFFSAARQLATLDAFNTVVTATVSATTNGREHEETMKSLVSVSHELSRKHSWTTWQLSASDGIDAPCETSLTVSAGIRKEGYFCGINVYSGSPTFSDRLLRAALFKRVIKALQLEDVIYVVVDDDQLWVKANPPWSLRFPSAGIGGVNPRAFNICGYSDVNTALCAGHCLTDHLNQRVACIRYVSQFSADGYKQVMSRLNALWTGWYFEIVGALSQKAIGILGGDEIDEESPSRIPAFRWWEEENGPQVFGSVVIDDGNRYLEIATDGGTLEMLQERVAFLDDIHFTPVFPNDPSPGMVTQKDDDMWKATLD